MKASRRTPSSRRGPREMDYERRAIADRRDDARRRKIEMLLDRLFRPGRWATRLFDAIGLQSARPVRVDQIRIVAQRPAGARPLRIAFASDFHAGATTAVRVL